MTESDVNVSVSTPSYTDPAVRNAVSVIPEFAHMCMSSGSVLPKVSDSLPKWNDSVGHSNLACNREALSINMERHYITLDERFWPLCSLYCPQLLK